MKNKICLFLSIILIFGSSLNVFAENLEFTRSVANKNGGLQDYIVSHYKLTADNICELSNKDEDCIKEGYKYPIVISYPVMKRCVNTVTWTVIPHREVSTVVCEPAGGKNTEGRFVTGTEIGDISTSETVDKSGKDKTYITTTSYIAASTTIYTNKQFEMSDIDINISDGKVVVTGVLNDDTAGWNIIYEKYKVIINGVLGICILSCVAAFIMLSMKLGSTAGNPNERKKVMAGILCSGIGTAALGAVMLFFQFFWNLL